MRLLLDKLSFTDDHRNSAKDCPLNEMCVATASTFEVHLIDVVDGERYSITNTEQADLRRWR